jgi:predicted RNA-binding protein YlqC (UPF0109 family)/PAS domain-containing protein
MIMPEELVSATEVGGGISALPGGKIAGGKEMGDLIRNRDWSTTSLGPMETWSETLCATVSLMLNAAVPSALYWGPELALLYNDGYRNNLANRHPAALGASAREVWADLWEAFGQQFEAVLSEGKSVIYEKVPIRLAVDGRMRDTFWSFSMSPIYEDGRVAGVYKISQNVTDEVHATNALVTTDERLRLALSATNCLGMWDWPIPTDLIFVGEQLALAHGMDPHGSRNGYPQAMLFQNLHPDDKEKALGALTRAIQTGEEYRMEYRVCQPGESVRWISNRGGCIYGDDGKPVRFLGIAFDITREREGVVECREDSPTIVLTSAPDRTRAIREMVEFVVVELVSGKNEVAVTSVDHGNLTHIIVKVAATDVERVVGENGQTAAAIRSLLAAASIKAGRNYSLEVVGEEFGKDLPIGWIVQ